MTKFILVGGYTRRGTDDGVAFWRELANGFAEPIKILECLFARPQDTWESVFTPDKEFAERSLSDKQLDIRLAQPETFIEQVRWADAIYLRGGDAELLLTEILKTKNFKDELDGKTIAGSSAGADALCKYYYSLDDIKLAEGAGILPFKVLVHYRSDYNAPNIDWDKAEAELKAYKEELPLITLKEGEFKVFQR